MRHRANVAHRVAVGDTGKIRRTRDLSAVGAVQDERLAFDHGFRDFRVFDETSDPFTVVGKRDVDAVFGVKAEIASDQYRETVLDNGKDGAAREREPQTAVDVQMVGTGYAGAEHDRTDVVYRAAVYERRFRGIRFRQGKGKADAVPSVVGDRKTVFVDLVILV